MGCICEGPLMGDSLQTNAIQPNASGPRVGPLAPHPLLPKLFRH